MKPEPKINDAIGELDSKMDMKLEIELEPAVKHEYCEEIMDIKLEGGVGEDYDFTLKKEDIVVVAPDDIKVEANLNTFTENETTFTHV